jgi:hypothetical protein
VLTTDEGLRSTDPDDLTTATVRIISFNLPWYREEGLAIEYVKSVPNRTHAPGKYRPEGISDEGLVGSIAEFVLLHLFVHIRSYSVR